MVTVNVSLPEKLKKEADFLVKSGVYVSFSDLVRDSLRSAIEENELDHLYSITKKDLASGKAIVLKNRRDINSFIKSIK